MEVILLQRIAYYFDRVERPPLSDRYTDETAASTRSAQALLDLPTPIYRHHPLLLGPDGKRYAKRNGSVTLAAQREAGVTPQELRAELGF